MRNIAIKLMVKTMSNTSSIPTEISSKTIMASKCVAFGMLGNRMKENIRLTPRREGNPHRQVKVVVAEVGSRVRGKATKGRQVRGTHKCSLLLKSRQARMMGKEPVSTENSGAAIDIRTQNTKFFLDILPIQSSL